MKSYMIIFLFAAAFSLSFIHDEKKDTASAITSSGKVDSSYETAKTTVENDSGVSASLRDFPTIHPLIVHFAIGFILIAALMQIANIFLLKREIAWIILVILLTGLVAAYLASSGFHPHTHGISEHARLVLHQHDEWAERTNFSALVALIIQVAYLLFVEFRNQRGKINQKTHRLLTLIIGAIMSFSAYSVLSAGHYGAQLVHIEGIGPQGKYLETEDVD